jgi:hypothetical protein
MPQKKTPATQGIDPGTFRLVAQCLKHYGTPDLLISVLIYLVNVLNEETSVEYNDNCSINLKHVFFRRALFPVINCFITLLPFIEIA